MQDRLLYNDKDLKGIERAGYLVPHGMYLEALPKKITGAYIANLLYKIGYHQFYGMSNFKVAFKCFQKAVNIFKNFFGENHERTGTTLEHLGNIWGALDGYEKHKDLLVQVLTIKQKCYGDNHPEIAQTLTNLGMAWGN